MYEENRKEELSDKKEPLHKNFLVRVGVVFISILILYFIISPYQNCMWERDNSFFCTKNTNW